MGMPDSIVFVHSSQPFTSYIAVLNTTTGIVTEHTDWPVVGAASGCPASLGPKEPTAFMYLTYKMPSTPPESVPHATGSTLERLSSFSATRWGMPQVMNWPWAKSEPCAQLKVTIGRARNQGVVKQMFPISLTDAPGIIGAHESSQCDRVWGADEPHNTSIICEGTDKTHNFFLKFDVSPTTGVTARNETRTLRHVMTPRPYVLYRNALRSSSDLVLV